MARPPQRVRQWRPGLPYDPKRRRDLFQVATLEGS